MIIFLISILINIIASVISWYVCIQQYNGIMFGEDVFTIILWWFVPLIGFVIGIILPFGMNAINPFNKFNKKIIFQRKEKS